MFPENRDAVKHRTLRGSNLTARRAGLANGQGPNALSIWPVSAPSDGTPGCPGVALEGLHFVIGDLEGEVDRLGCDLGSGLFCQFVDVGNRAEAWIAWWIWRQ
jgi:hypothetical protein